MLVASLPALFEPFATLDTGSQVSMRSSDLLTCHQLNDDVWLSCLRLSSCVFRYRVSRGTL